MAAVRTSIVLACAAVAALATSDVRMSADQPAPIPPVNDAPNPYNTIKDYFKLPERPPVGIDERRRHRQGRQVDLGRRALRQQQLPRSRRPNQDSERSDHPEIRHQRQARQELRRRHVDLPARHSRRPRRQHLGHRRPGQRAASGARRWRGRGARRRCSRRWWSSRPAAPARGGGAPPQPQRANPARPRAIRCSSSARTASC